MIIKLLYPVLFLSLFFLFYALLNYIKKEKLLDRTLKQVSEQINEHSRVRQKQLKDSFQNGKKGLLKLEKLLYGSGLKKAAPFLSVELLIVLMVGLAGTGYFVLCLLQAPFPVKLMALAGGPLLLYFILQVKCLINYNRIENNLIVFLNLLDSFSITAGEVTSILYKVSRFMEPPLKDMLEECYFEAQVTGDTSKALYHFMEKAGHPKLREIIRNIEVCSRYDADYASVVKSSRKSIQDYLAYRKRRKSVINVAKTEMFILVLMVLILLQIINFLIPANAWSIVFHTAAGRGIFNCMILLLTGFYCRIVLFDKG